MTVLRKHALFATFWKAAKDLKARPEEVLDVIAQMAATLASVRSETERDRAHFLASFQEKVRDAAVQIDLKDARKRAREILTGRPAVRTLSVPDEPVFYDEVTKTKLRRKGGRKDCSHRVRQGEACMECGAKFEKVGPQS